MPFAIGSATALCRPVADCCHHEHERRKLLWAAERDCDHDLALAPARRSTEWTHQKLKQKQQRQRSRPLEEYVASRSSHARLRAVVCSSVAAQAAVAVPTRLWACAAMIEQTVTQKQLRRRELKTRQERPRASVTQIQMQLQCHYEIVSEIRQNWIVCERQEPPSRTIVEYRAAQRKKMQQQVRVTRRATSASTVTAIAPKPMGPDGEHGWASVLSDPSVERVL